MGRKLEESEMVKKFSIFWCFLLIVGSSLAQTVTNVRAEQEQSDIVVAYDLEAKEPCNIEVYVSPDGGRSWQGPLVNLSGDAGKNISAGAKKCRWAVLKEQDQLKGTDVRFKVIAALDAPFKSVTIGNQVWSVENLNTAQFSNGDKISEAKTYVEWQTMGEQGKAAWCYYNNDPANSKKYGKLYNWYAVADARGLCPAGWHVPSDAEWTQLSNTLGGENYAGAKMKSANGWNHGGDGNNRSSFTGLPGGFRNDSGSFNYIGYFGYWWSSTQYSTTYAWFRYLFFSNAFVNRNYNAKRVGFSVRCVRD
jgi:uncharacterized protein (TIGR02145 family)